MSKLNKKKVWFVRDPGPSSEMVDIFWETTFEKCINHIIGTGGNRWMKENTTWYDNEREAKADAEKRMAKKAKKAYDYDRT